MLRFDRRLLTNFDWILLVLTMLIVGIGLINLYSAGYNLVPPDETPFYVKQFHWFLIGLGLMLLTFSVDYRLLVEYSPLIYIVSVLLLCIVFFYGKVTHGSQRWLVLWGFSFQASELMKITIILALTKYLSESIGDVYNLRNLAIVVSIIAVPFFLIVKQPDLGTALFLGILLFSMIGFIGVKKKLFFSLVGAATFLAPACWFFLKDYQRERILTFLNPERDPLGAGYNIIQSFIAIGSGNIWGKGFMKGTQSQLKFLPEQQTDFVFSVFAEEWGFLGGLILILLFFALSLWGMRIAKYSRDLSGTLIAYGISMYIFWGVFINMAMVLGLLPVVGIPLPFFSYGGSSMVVLMIGIGLLMNVSMRRFILQP